MSPLEEATTEQLIGELCSRFTACVFAGVQEPDPANDRLAVVTDGSLFTCLGVLAEAQRRVRRQLDAAFRGEEEL